MSRKLTRLDFIAKIFRTFFLFILSGFGITRLVLSTPENFVWQIDPKNCEKCGKCATDCVLTQSAVKSVHNLSMCGYCNLCFGFFQPGTKRFTEDAENQLCPTGAIKRKFIEVPYFEYTIDESLCIGCGKCVKGCTLFGNGSLYLQINQDLCQNCNECSISRVCAGDAFNRIPAEKGYIKKG